MNLAVVGAGRWGEKLVRTAAGLTRCRVSTICDEDGSRLRSYAESRARLVDCADEVFRDPALRAVVIATPPDTHARLAIAALAAGKHVFVEKPLALRSSDADAVAAAAKRASRCVLVGHLLRYHPAIAQMAELVRCGAIGDLCHFQSHRVGRKGNGDCLATWWQLAPHDISLARAFFAAEPLWVAAKRSDHRERIVAQLLFPRGGCAELIVGRSAGAQTRRITLSGTRGVSRLDDCGSESRLRVHALNAAFERQVEQRTITLGESRVPGVQPCKPPLTVELEHFLDAIQYGTPILTDVEEGVRVVAVLEAGAASLAGGGKWMPVAQPSAADTLPTAEVA